MRNLAIGFWLATLATVSLPASPSQTVVSYTYDALGNIKTIQRSIVASVNGPPSISSFTPGCATAATTVSISGGNFNPVPGTTTVLLGATAVSANVLATNAIAFSVPAGASSAHIAVTTAAGTASSANPLLVPPAGFACPDFSAATRSIAAGASTQLSILAGKKGAVLFDGTIGTWLSFHAAGVATAPASAQIGYTLYGPGNVALASGTASGVAFSIHLPPLPSTGTYFLQLAPAAGATATVPLNLQNDSLLVVDGASVPLGAIQPGQSQRTRFSGSAGQLLGVGGTGVTGTLALSYLKPDGSTLFSSNWSANASDDLPILTATGTHTILVTASGGTAGNATVWLSTDVADTLTLNAGAKVFQTTRAGQNGRFAFTAPGNSTAAVILSGNTFASAQVQLRRPDGTVAASTTVSSPTGQIALQQLVAAGTYNVFISGAGASTGSIQVAVGVPVQVAVADPDLVVTNLSGMSTSTRPGGGYDISLTYTVTNNGVGSADGPWYDLAYLSADNALDNGDHNLSGFNLRAAGTSLPAGGSYSATVTFGTTAATAAGAYWLFVKVDGRGATAGAGTNTDSGSVRETNEANNALSNAVVLGADLVLSNVTVVSTSPRAGGGFNIQVSYKVTNAGTSAAAGPWYDMAYLSLKPTLLDSDQNLAGPNYRAAGTSLGPGAFYNATVTFSTDATTFAGSYTLTIKTDGRGVQAGAGTNTDTGNVSETNESNNVVQVRVAL